MIPLPVVKGFNAEEQAPECETWSQPSEQNPQKIKSKTDHSFRNTPTTHATSANLRCRRSAKCPAWLRKKKKKRKRGRPEPQKHSAFPSV